MKAKTIAFLIATALASSTASAGYGWLYSDKEWEARQQEHQRQFEQDVRDWEENQRWSRQRREDEEREIRQRQAIEEQTRRIEKQLRELER